MNIRTERIQAGRVSQTKLSQTTGLSRSRIAKIEQGYAEATAAERDKIRRALFKIVKQRAARFAAAAAKAEGTALSA